MGMNHTHRHSDHDHDVEFIEKLDAELQDLPKEIYIGKSLIICLHNESQRVTANHALVTKISHSIHPRLKNTEPQKHTLSNSNNKCSVLCQLMFILTKK